MISLIVASWLALQVQGAGNCPMPAQVEEKLAPLLPVGFMSSSTDRATIADESDGGLSVSLAHPDGSPIARRRLPRAASCSEQAEMVAVVLAVWEAQIHPEISLRLDRLGASPSPSNVAPPAATGPVVIEQADEKGSPRPIDLGVGVAAMGGWQPGSVAPGVRGDVLLGYSNSRWRARLSLAGLGVHSENVAPGQARWWRLYLALGADYVFYLGRHWDLALGLAGVLGVVTAEGEGYTTDRTTRSADVGVESILRADLRLGAIRPWLGLAILTWLERQTLAVAGTDASVVLPVVEPMIALGTDFYW